MAKNCHVLHLRNHTSYHLRLWYTCVKGYYVQVFFIFFLNFNFQGFGKRAKRPKIKKCLSHSMFQKAYITWCNFSYTCVKWFISRSFFHCFKILILWVVGVKGKKMTQMAKSFVRLTPYLRNRTPCDCGL